MSERRTQVRILLTDNFKLIVLALLLVTGTGAFVTYTAHVEPGTTTEERQVSSWESSGEFFHQATVQNDTEVYTKGTVLHNQSVYFQQLTPELNGVFVHEYTASGGGNLSVTTDVALRLRSIDADTQGNGTVYWQTETQLATDSKVGVRSGERVNVPFSLNVTETNQRLATVDEQFGGTPGEKQALLVATVTTSGTRNGEPVNQTQTYQLPLTTQGSVYRVDDPGAVTASDGQIERVSVPAEYGLPWLVGGPFLLIVGVIGLSAVSYYSWSAPSVTEAERTWYAYRQTRAEFDEWITVGQVPQGLSKRPTITTESLSGLVDLAIDTDGRVLQDEDRGAYLVLGEDHWYEYEMPPEPDQGNEQSSDAEAVSDSTAEEESDRQSSDPLDVSASSSDR